MFEISIIEKIKELRGRLSEKKLTGSEGLLYLHILADWNYYGRSKPVRLGDKEAMKRTGLGRYALRKARKGLEEKEYVSCKRGRRGCQTEYTIL